MDAARRHITGVLELAQWPTADPCRVGCPVEAGQSCCHGTCSAALQIRRRPFGTEASSGDGVRQAFWSHTLWMPNAHGAGKWPSIARSSAGTRSHLNLNAGGCSRTLPLNSHPRRRGRPRRRAWLVVQLCLLRTTFKRRATMVGFAGHGEFTGIATVFEVIEVASLPTPHQRAARALVGREVFSRVVSWCDSPPTHRWRHGRRSHLHGWYNRSAHPAATKTLFCCFRGWWLGVVRIAPRSFPLGSELS